MSGLIFLAILFYAISYIAKEGKAKRKAGGAARPQRSEAASAQFERPLRQGTPYAPRSGAYRSAAAPRPEPDVELCTHDRPEAFQPSMPPSMTKTFFAPIVRKSHQTRGAVKMPGPS